MGKKRIIKKGSEGSESASSVASSRSIAKKLKHRTTTGLMFINSTYNNTIINFTDDQGGTLFWSSAGALGFKGAKKGTPFASSKVAELLSEKSKAIGVSEIGIFVKGVGAGRESAIRSFASNGLNINFIKDVTPLPHNGTKSPKVRRV